MQIVKVNQNRKELIVITKVCIVSWLAGVLLTYAPVGSAYAASNLTATQSELQQIANQFTTMANVPQTKLICYDSLKDYFTGTFIKSFVPNPGGVAGDADSSNNVISLSPQTCENIQAVINNPSQYTWPRAYSIMVVGHEITHFTGIKLMSTYGWFDSNETDADCGGAQKASSIAYLLGVRSTTFFAGLHSAFIQRVWGYSYETLLPQCWNSVEQ